MQCPPRGPRRGPVLVGDLGDQPGQVGLAFLHGQGPAFGTGELQQVVDDRKRIGDASADALHGVGLVGPELAVQSHLHQLGVAVRRTQRVLYVVRNAAHQPVPGGKRVLGLSEGPERHRSEAVRSSGNADGVRRRILQLYLQGTNGTRGALTPDT